MSIGQFFEGTRDIVFPSPGKVRDEIPLWMKFYCYEYNSTALGRVSIKTRSHNGFSVPGLSNLKAKILVPAPTNFETSTNPKYATVNQSKNLAIFPSALGVGTLANITAKMASTLATFADEVGQAAFAEAGFDGGTNTPDFFDLVFKGGGPSRQYEIRLYLPCLTHADSVAAGAISRSFEALALPTSTGIGTDVTFYHPPIWIFGIGAADSLQIDQDWSGSPQISVLTMVKVRKQALETNAITAHKSSSSFKPVAYSLTLMFREIEPAIRRVELGASTGIDITNRSGAMISLGIKIT